MTKKQTELLEKLRANHCNISDALEYTDGVSLTDFYGFLKNEDFKEAYDEAVQIRDDFADEAFMDLIGEGDKSATIEYQKMKRQSDDANDARQIRKEVMRVLVELADTKGRCLSEYCDIFKASSKMAEKQYSAVVAEFQLKTPYERAKERKKKKESLMATRFENGDLSEVQMFQGMLIGALFDAESSEYPSERKGARQDIVSITTCLGEINERERRAAESDETALVDKLDCSISGASPEDVAIMKQKIIAGPMAIIEGDADADA